MPSAAESARATKSTRARVARMSLAEVMAALEAAGAEQTRKTYARHGVTQPMFGVSFATLKTLMKRIGVDHELGLALWQTENFDARNLAVKIVDPGRLTVAELDAMALGHGARMCSSHVAHLAVEGSHADVCAKRWLTATDEVQRHVGWGLVGALAMRDAARDDAWFEQQLPVIEASILTAPNAHREAMNHALIAIGGRSPALRQAATAVARRIGKVEVDHGDTACKTPDAQTCIDKAWDHAKAKGFDSPAAQERGRESMRTRC